MEFKAKYWTHKKWREKCGNKKRFYYRWLLAASLYNWVLIGKPFKHIQITVLGFMFGVKWKI